MSTRDRLGLAAAAAVLLACAALVPVFAGLGWLWPVVGAVAVVAGACAAARHVGLTRLLHPVAALAGLAAYVCVVFAPGTLAYAVLPTGATLTALRTTVGRGLLDVEALAAPVPTRPGLVLLAVLGVGAIAVVVDTLAVTLRQAAAAGAPLLLLFAVPSAVLAQGLGVVPFVAGAAGWLGLLLADSRDTVSRWGAPLASRRSSAADPGSARVGRRIGLAALGVAVVVPALLPGLDARVLGGNGDGLGGGSRSVTTYNPITRLSGQLNLPVPRELLRYTTDDPTPSYLRLTTLDRFDQDTGWSSSPLTADRRDDRARDGTPIPGLTLPGTRSYDVTITVTGGLDGPWLPLPFPPSGVAVTGPWLWDQRAETVFSTGTSLAKLDGPYTVTTREIQPTADVLRRGGVVPAQIRDDYARPPALSPYVRNEIARTTAGLTTDYDRVAALQAYFLDRSRFVYDTDARTPEVSSGSALEDFLRRGRGFCQQYASSMAAMVRSLGIPVRVAVGFTAGNKAPDGSWVVTTSEAHAWPEVWFPEAGWTRFEPTPRRDGQTSQPAYSEAPAVTGEGPTLPTAPTPGPSVAPVDPGTAQSRDRAAQDGASTATTGGAGPSPWLLLVPGTVLLLTAPWLLAQARTRRRWRRPDARTAWELVVDHAVDVGHRWRSQDSPRSGAAHLAAARPLSPAAAAALQRLATRAEQERYARPSGRTRPDAVDLRRDVAAVRAGLQAGASRRARWVARLAPPSTLRWASAGVGSALADALDRVDTATTALGARLRRPRTGRA